MVEPFLKEFLGADMVLGTEIATYKSRATGWVLSPGVLVDRCKASALNKAFGTETSSAPDVGLGDRKTDYPFMKLCKESYVVPATPEVKAVSLDKLPKPIVFHDGRLVQKPSHCFLCTSYTTLFGRWVYGCTLKEPHRLPPRNQWAKPESLSFAHTTLSSTFILAQDSSGKSQ